LLLQQTLSALLKESYVMLDEHAKKEQIPFLQDQQLYFFGYGDTTENTHQVEKDLTIKDLAEGQNLQIKYPVCFECFDYVITRMDTKIQSKEKERELYLKELAKLEGKLAKCNTEA
jgi:hypothetical protein